MEGKSMDWIRCNGGPPGDGTGVSVGNVWGWGGGGEEGV